MKTIDERRITQRSPIRVLVKCLPPDVPVRRNGHESHGWEMWARNIADDGVGLRWSREWSNRRYVLTPKDLDERTRNYESSQKSPSAFLKKGQEVCLDGLIYTEKGSKIMKGRICWVKTAKNGAIFDVGVHITSPNHRSFFKVLEG